MTLQRAVQSLLQLLRQRVLGQEEITEQVVATLLCGSHALLTGAPGVAKTTLVRTLACALGCGYKRIQFTPDLTPFDILGGETIRFNNDSSDRKSFEFLPGPIFTHFLLADEINRASPRTQSALLEAMQERQVSLGGITHSLPKPFYVFATQNPIESEGTFPLPDAQLDRFLMDIHVPYPDFEAELAIATLSPAGHEVSPLEEASQLLEAHKSVVNIQVPETVLKGIVRLVRSTRPEDSSLSFVKEFLDYGASPRASQALVLASQALAFIWGENQVSPEMVIKMAPPVLRHRCVPNFKALAQRKDANSLVKWVVNECIM